VQGDHPVEHLQFLEWEAADKKRMLGPGNRGCSWGHSMALCPEHNHFGTVGLKTNQHVSKCGVISQVSICVVTVGILIQYLACTSVSLCGVFIWRSLELRVLILNSRDLPIFESSVLNMVSDTWQVLNENFFGVDE
jgi:hypothetical protein